MSVNKTYVYKVYRGNIYQGNLPNVISQFSYSQDINTPGAELQVQIGNKFDDVGAVQTDDFWVDEAGNQIVDEAGNQLVFSKSINFTNIPIDIGNRVKVYTFDSNYPNGLLVFDGLISNWGTNYKSNIVHITVLSYGVQLANYLLSADPTGTTIDQESYNKEYAPTADNKGSAALPIAQSFNIASPTIVGSFTLFVRGTADFFTGGSPPDHVYPISILNWFLYSGLPSASGSLIDSGVVDFTGVAVQEINLQFAVPKTLSGNYYLVFYNGTGGSWYYGTPYIEATSTNPYASGSVYTGDDSSGTTVWTAVAADDLAFIVNNSSGSSSLSYTNQDPSTIMERIMDQLSAQGGVPSYTSSSIAQTGISSSYTYKVATILEGIQTAYTLAPDGWFWYIDVGNNLLYFQQFNDTEDHVLVLGKHFIDADIKYTLEQVINYVVFSGGNTGSGSNLYLIRSSASSIDNYGQWLSKQSDNRVTDQATGELLANGVLNRNQMPSFIVTLEVSANIYDIEKFKLGDVVGLRNFNNLLDTEPLQIVSKTIGPDSVILKLGNILPRASNALQELKKRLNAQETIANPNTPS